MNDSLHSYLLSTIKKKDPDIEKIEEYAVQHHVPIMEPLSIEFLIQLIRLAKPRRILEIGAAIGYSAIRMAEAYPNSEVITIERDEERYEQALRNIAQRKLTARINVVKGDALEDSNLLIEQGPFDLLFIDAAKGQYKKFFETYAPSLTKSGVIISDNVLFKGYVADEKQPEKKRIKQLTEKIRSYNDWLVNHPDYDTIIVPIGDGIAITTKE